MSLTLELKKIKRTGFFPAFLAGGIIAGAFPIINTLPARRCSHPCPNPRQKS